MVSVQPVSVRSSTSRIGFPARSRQRCREFARDNIAVKDGAEPLRAVRAIARAKRRYGSRCPGTAGVRSARCAWQGSAISCGRVCEPMDTTAAGRSLHSQAASTLTAALTRSSGTSASGRSGASTSRTRRAEAEVGHAGNGAARLGHLVAPGYVPTRGTPSAAIADGHWRRGSIVTPGRPSRSCAALTVCTPIPAGGDVVPPQLSQRPHRSAKGSSSCSRRNCIRQRAGGDIVTHRLLLRQAGRRDPRIPLGIVVPGLAGALPAGSDPAHRAIHVEHLEHRLQP